MERGLLWLPLLAVFVWLAWSGWKEYQKVEAYRVWAAPFQRAKYDLYAVLAQTGTQLTWGNPTPQGPKNLETFSLEEVQALKLLVNDRPVDLDDPPTQGKRFALEFSLSPEREKICIPFTELPLAVEWGNHLRKDWLRSQSAKSNLSQEASDSDASNSQAEGLA